MHNKIIDKKHFSNGRVPLLDPGRHALDQLCIPDPVRVMTL